MAKIKVDEPLKTPKGKPIVERSDDGDRPLSVGDILIQALSVGYDRNTQLTTADYALTFKLSQKIGSPEVDMVTLKSDEIVFLKKCVERLPQALGLSAYVAAQVLNALEPFEEEKKEVA